MSAFKLPKPQTYNVGAPHKAPAKPAIAPKKPSPSSYERLKDRFKQK